MEISPAMPYSGYAEVDVTMRESVTLEEMQSHLKVTMATDVVLTWRTDDNRLIGITNPEQPSSQAVFAAINETYNNVIEITDASSGHHTGIKSVEWI